MPKTIKKDSYVVNKETGEITNSLSSGDLIITASDKSAKRKRQEIEEKKEFRRTQTNELGGFVLLRIKHLPDDLSSTELGRLTMLSTFVGYDNHLMINERTYMKKTDLPKVLNINSDTAGKFLMRVSPKYLNIEDDGRIAISNAFYKGTVKEYQRDKKTRLFIETAQNLYYQMKPRAHKYFGMVISLIPYINTEWNILCDNPEEKCIDRVHAMTVGELCERLEYDAGKSDRLLDSICGLLFETNDIQRSLCSVVRYQSAEQSGYRIFINPRIIFNGSDFKQVEGLCTFFPGKKRCYNKD